MRQSLHTVHQNELQGRVHGHRFDATALRFRAAGAAMANEFAVR